MSTKGTAGHNRLFVAATLLAVCLGVGPATQPLTPEQAVRRNNIALIQTLLAEPTAMDLVHLGRHFRGQQDFPRATAIDLVALRGQPNDPDLEYEVACDFAVWNQPKLGMEFFQKAADHGYWGYPTAAEDTDIKTLRTDPAFPAALDKIKAAFATESPKHAPGQTIKMPTGVAPAAGWPVMVFLHGYGSSRHDFDDLAAYVATLGYVGVTLDGNNVMANDAYSWGGELDQTQQRVHGVVKSLGVLVDAKRIYLQGFSQGAMHAVRLLADHPADYAGAICDSPGAAVLTPEMLTDPATTPPLIMTVGDQEDASIVTAANAIQSLWQTAGRPVRIVSFHGGHQLPPDPQTLVHDTLMAWATAK